MDLIFIQLLSILSIRSIVILEREYIYEDITVPENLYHDDHPELVDERVYMVPPPPPRYITWILLAFSENTSIENPEPNVSGKFNNVLDIVIEIE